ncbi:extracellular solute-binding protein [Microbacterium sp. GXF0217]
MSILAGASALALALGGCSGAGGDDPSKKTLTVMFWGDERAPADWKALGEAFQADGHEDVEFKFIHQPAEYDTKLQTLVAANNTPDVFLMNSAGMGRFIDAGTLLDLAPVYAELGIDLASEYREQAIWQEGDSVWGIAPTIHLMAMFYDKATFDAAGVDYPSTDPASAWSWDEFVRAATDLSDPATEDDGWGAMVLTDPLVTAPLLASNGGYWFDPDATEFTLDEPESVEVYEAIKTLADDGVSIPPQNLSSMGLDVVLQSRKAALYPGGTWNLPAIEEAWGDDAGMAILPSFGDPKSLAVTDQFVASNKTANPELAAEFIRFATDAQNNPHAFDGVPASSSASVTASATTPVGYEETIDNALSVTMDDPSRKVRDLNDIWARVQWTDEGINGYFNELVPDLGKALTGVKPDIDAMLQGE